MTAHAKATFVLAQAILQRLSLATIVIVTTGLVTLTTLAALGAVPWLGFEATVGDTVYANAGQIFQIGVTALAVILCFFLPSHARLMKLETTHRRFDMNMNDVARAYASVHGADRAGVFTLSAEFDAVRERLAYLNDHPDLGSLEPALLEVAAQMSHVSQELARVYSDEKVARARTFLTQRQQELEAFEARLDTAKAVCMDLKHWARQVELGESVAQSQVGRLREDLADILPELDQHASARRVRTVIDNSKTAAE